MGCDCLVRVRTPFVCTVYLQPTHTALECSLRTVHVFASVVTFQICVFAGTYPASLETNYFSFSGGRGGGGGGGGRGVNVWCCCWCTCWKLGGGESAPDPGCGGGGLRADGYEGDQRRRDGLSDTRDCRFVRRGECISPSPSGWRPLPPGSWS